MKVVRYLNVLIELAFVAFVLLRFRPIPEVVVLCLAVCLINFVLRVVLLDDPAEKSIARQVMIGFSLVAVTGTALWMANLAGGSVGDGIGNLTAHDSANVKALFWSFLSSVIALDGYVIAKYSIPVE